MAIPIFGFPRLLHVPSGVRYGVLGSHSAGLGHSFCIMVPEMSALVNVNWSDFMGSEIKATLNTCVR